jgi:hypothetical protein
MKQSARIITLLTDFGYRDAYVGVMKGVILGICPGVSLIDLTHGVSPGGVAEAAFLIERSYRCFPRGSFHLVVVDPGVGGNRLPMVLETGGHTFVGPDNGVLSRVIEEADKAGTPWTATVIENPDAMLPQVSSTFHGRDLFAPVIAHLARGEKVRGMGRRLDNPSMLRPVGVEVRGDEIRGEIVYVDRFGNLVSNISPADLGDPSSVTVYLMRKRIGPVQPSYDAVPPGYPVAVMGGFDRLEVSLNRGSAADVFGVGIGGRIRVVRRRPLLLRARKSV